MGTSNKQLTIVIEEQNMKLRPTVREIKAVVGLTKKSTRVDEGTIFVQQIHILSHKINLRNHLISLWNAHDRFTSLEDEVGIVTPHLYFLLG